MRRVVCSRCAADWTNGHICPDGMFRGDSTVIYEPNPNRILSGSEMEQIRVLGWDIAQIAIAQAYWREHHLEDPKPASLKVRE